MQQKLSRSVETSIVIYCQTGISKEVKVTIKDLLYVKAVNCLLKKLMKQNTCLRAEYQLSWIFSFQLLPLGNHCTISSGSGKLLSDSRWSTSWNSDTQYSSGFWRGLGFAGGCSFCPYPQPPLPSLLKELCHEHSTSCSQNSRGGLSFWVRQWTISGCCYPTLRPK